MITFTNFTGLFSLVILIVTMATAAFCAARISPYYSALLAVIVTVIACIPIPFGGLPLIAYVRGATGDLSVTSQVLLLLMVLKFLTKRELFSPSQKISLWILIVLGGAILYPFALGMGNFDSYRIGFGNIWFLAILFLITVAAFAKQFYLVAGCIALAVLAWSVGWNEANNLWNYLMDPLVVICAAGALINEGISLLRARKTIPTN